MKRIEPGQILTARSVCDSDCIFSARVIERKGNWVKVEEYGEVKRKKIELDYNGNECVYVDGKYSMAPCYRP